MKTLLLLALLCVAGCHARPCQVRVRVVTVTPVLCRSGLPGPGRNPMKSRLASVLVMAISGVVMVLARDPAAYVVGGILSGMMIVVGRGR